MNKKLVFIPVIMIILGALTFVLESNLGYGAIESHTTNDVIGNLTYLQWVESWWNWHISLPKFALPSSENATSMSGCLVGKDDQNKTIFLVDSFFGGSVQQYCSFKADQSILIPLLTAECDTGDRNVGKTFDEVLKCALSDDDFDAYLKVTLDDAPLVDTKVSLHNTPQHNHLIEIQSKDFFEVIAPATSQFEYAVPGTYSGAAHGWFVFLKPLDEGNHVISYSAALGGKGLDVKGESSAQDIVTYHINIKK
jgi:hypothetical protein